MVGISDAEFDLHKHITVYTPEQAHHRLHARAGKRVRRAHSVGLDAERPFRDGPGCGLDVTLERWSDVINEPVTMRE